MKFNHPKLRQSYQPLESRRSRPYSHALSPQFHLPLGPHPSRKYRSHESSPAGSPISSPKDYYKYDYHVESPAEPIRFNEHWYDNNCSSDSDAFQYTESYGFPIEPEYQSNQSTRTLCQNTPPLLENNKRKLEQE
jgi:hypothetical protein